MTLSGLALSWITLVLELIRCFLLKFTVELVVKVKGFLDGSLVIFDTFLMTSSFLVAMFSYVVDALRVASELWFGLVSTFVFGPFQFAQRLVNYRKGILD